MKMNTENYSKFLEKVAEEIDIPPNKYQDAVDRYRAVGSWLENGHYQGCAGKPSIYPQGSFCLGTVVRPIRGGIEADYDIDLVCDLLIPKDWTNAQSVKIMVGNRLYEHGKYRELLKEEGKRCWTLKYAEQDGVGFHLDVLPSVPDPRDNLLDTSIAITNKKGTTYDWSASNPKGYSEWFDSMNKHAFDAVQIAQKRLIQSRASTIYASIDEVPDQLVRTSLQRSIQILKRHRDLRFSDSQNSEYAPISIIITTLAAQLYQGEADTFSALTGIISKLHVYAGLIENRPVDWNSALSNLVRRTSDGKWYIGNPVNSEENFADRWHEDSHARARAFFSWVEVLKEDFVDILTVSSLEMRRKRLAVALGASVVSNHFDLIAPVSAAVFIPPKVHISTPPKPWRT